MRIFAVAARTCARLPHTLRRIIMTTSTIIFRVSNFESDSAAESLPSHFVTLFVKSNSFDKDIDWLIKSLTDQSSWKTLVESSTVYFPELADEKNQIKLSFIGIYIFLNVKNK